MESDGDKKLIARYIARERIMISIMTDRDGRWTDDYVRQACKQGWLLFSNPKTGDSVFPNEGPFKSSAIIARKLILLSAEEIESVVALARKVQEEIKASLGEK